MAPEPAVVLAAAQVLDVKLGRWVIDNLAQHASSFKHGLTNLQTFGALEQQNSLKLKVGTDFKIPVVDLNDIAFAHRVYRDR